jgi:hypothetical protein
MSNNHTQDPSHNNHPMHAAYVARVAELEKIEGCNTSDAQGIADAEFRTAEFPTVPNFVADNMEGKAKVAGICNVVELTAEADGICGGLKVTLLGEDKDGGLYQLVTYRECPTSLARVLQAIHERPRA